MKDGGGVWSHDRLTAVDLAPYVRYSESMIWYDTRTSAWNRQDGIETLVERSYAIGFAI